MRCKFLAMTVNTKLTVDVRHIKGSLNISRCVRGLVGLVAMALALEQQVIAGKYLHYAGRHLASPISMAGGAPGELTGPRPAPAGRQGRSAKPAAMFGGHSIWSDLEGWRRNKRDIEDRLVLASRRAAAAAAASRRPPADGHAARGNNDEDFAIDDGDEDAWVHDGVDDIHIDPETKRAASELSRDESNSIDAEYDPNNGGAAHESESPPPVVNRTRVTTISEVIPMNSDELDSISPPKQPAGPAAPWPGRRVQMMASAAGPGAGPLLPASYLTLDQVQRLIDAQRHQEEPEQE